jgi:hypothetical protein
MSFLKGKRTFIISALAVALNFAVFMNWITVDQMAQVNAVLAFLGLSALRAAV